MKALFSVLMLLSSVVFADGVVCPPGWTWEYDTCGRPDYSCVAQRMQATDSDIFYNLSEAEIEQILNNPGAVGHDLAVAAAKECSGGQ